MMTLLCATVFPVGLSSWDGLFSLIIKLSFTKIEQREIFCLREHFGRRGSINGTASDASVLLLGYIRRYTENTKV